MISNEKPPHWGEWNIKDTSFKKYISQNIISVIVNHAFFDGFSLWENIFFKVIAHDSEMWDVKRPSFMYYPMLSEYRMFKSLCEMLLFPKRGLEICVPSNKKNIIHSFGQSTIKKIKNECNTGYSISLAALLLKYMFSTMNENKTYINFCMVFAFSNSFCFNNLGIIAVHVKKSLDINNLVRQLESGLKNSVSQMYSSYILSAFVNGKYTSNNQCIDCIFNCMPVSKGKIMINNSSELTSGDMVIPNLRIPIYIYGCSYDNKQGCCININTPDIDRDMFAEEFSQLTI